jgi:hypothetical protein
MLTCVSSETRSHDVVGAYGEAKMKTHKVKQRGISKATRGLFPEKRTELRGFGHTDPLGSSQIFKNQAGMVTPEADKSSDTCLTVMWRAPGRTRGSRQVIRHRKLRVGVV